MRASGWIAYELSGDRWFRFGEVPVRTGLWPWPCPWLWPRLSRGYGHGFDHGFVHGRKTGGRIPVPKGRRPHTSSERPKAVAHFSVSWFGSGKGFPLVVSCDTTTMEHAATLEETTTITRAHTAAAAARSRTTSLRFNRVLIFKSRTHIEMEVGRLPPPLCGKYYLPRCIRRTSLSAISTSPTAVKSTRVL